MLLPPFTVLIVKKNRRPVTVHVTGWFIFIVLVLCGSVLTGAAMIAGRLTSVSPDQQAIGQPPAPIASATYTLTETPADQAQETAGPAPVTPDIAEFEVTRAESGDVVFSFSVANAPEGEELFLWIMVNPGSDEPDKSAIYPRSPLFRGLPVDFRNGIRHIPLKGRLLRLTFSGPEAGITLDRFRILAYEPSGDLIIDKTLTVQETIRM